MYIDRIETSGLSGLGTWTGDLGRVASFSGPPRRLAALADALVVPFAALEVGQLLALAAGWGLRNVVGDSDGGVSARWDAAPWLRSLVGAEGTLLSTVRMTLDPPIFGRLRALAERDPRLVDALAAGPTLSLVTGLRFSTGWDAAAAELLGVRVGEHSFPTAGADKPSWLDGLVRGMGRRLQRGGLPRAAWARAAGSWVPTEQRGLDRAIAAAAAPPASLGRLVPLPDGPAVWTDELVPVDRYGAAASRAVEVIGAVHLSGADMLVVPDADPAWRDWLAAQVEGEDSPLEQVILLGVAGAPEL